MAQRKEHLDQYIDEARSLPSLHTSETLQQLIIQSDSDSARTGAGRSTSIQKQITIMSITLTIIAGSIYGLFQMLQPADNPTPGTTVSASSRTARPYHPVLPDAPASPEPYRPAASSVASQHVRPAATPLQVTRYPVRHQPNKPVLVIPAGDIPGMNMTQISRSEAEKLGITFRDGEIGYYERYGRNDLDLNDPEMRRFLISIGVDTANPEYFTRIEISPNSIGSGPARNPVTARAFAPLMVTNLHPDNGGFSTFLSGRLPRDREFDADFERELNTGLDSLTSTIDSIRHRIDKFRIRMMDKLIPLLITPDEKSGVDKPWQVILWFYPTPEFLEALPVELGRNLEAELARAETTSTSDAPATETVHPGESSYLDIWRARSGAITQSQAFPIPALHDAITLRYTLDAARGVSVTVHDINGRRLKELVKSQERATGTWEEKISVEDLDRGIYLLSINTDRGEHAVQRIVVQ
jgi:hypothetical protein